MRKVFLISFLFLFGCTIEAPEKTTPPENQVPVPLSFDAGIINTKVPIVSVSGVPTVQIDGIQVLRQDVHKNSSPTWNTVSSVTTTASFFTTGSFIATPKQFYNSKQNQYAHFTAYYPGVNENAVATTLSNGVATFTITGQEDIISAPSASAQGNGNPIPVALTFSHKLSQVQIYIKAASAGAISAWGTLRQLKPLPHGAHPERIHSSPGTTRHSCSDRPINGKPSQALTTDFVSFGSILVYRSPDHKSSLCQCAGTNRNHYPSITTVAGSAHRIDLTFTATAINFSATLTDWVTGTAGTGTVQPDPDNACTEPLLYLFHYLFSHDVRLLKLSDSP